MFDFKLCPSGQTKLEGGEADVEDTDYDDGGAAPDIEQSVEQEECLKMSNVSNYEFVSN